MSYATRRLTRKRNKELSATNKALECANADLTARDNTITNLRDDATERAAELSRAQTTISDQAQAIATFKEEHLTLMLEVAEMRGYISRTLEDDHVREFGPAKMMAEPALDTGEREQMMRALHDDAQRRRQPAKPVRRGPASMTPMQICDAAMSLGGGLSGGDDWTSVARNGRIQSAPPRPKHWTAR